jgi:hypothetical protein
MIRLSRRGLGLLILTQARSSSSSTPGRGLVDAPAPSRTEPDRPTPHATYEDVYKLTYPGAAPAPSLRPHYRASPLLEDVEGTEHGVGVRLHQLRPAGAWRGPAGKAIGSEPFLLSSYLLSGRDSSEFETWIQTFCGTNRPEDDVADYLDDVYGIDVQGLLEFVERADPTTVAMVGEIWHEARDAKDERLAKMGVPPMDTVTRSLLVSHDVENYVGVQMRREARRERRSAFGYKSWWLTLDGTAFRVKALLADRLDGRPMESPAISPDFMLHYLAVGPVRGRLSRRTEETLPLMLNMSVLDAVPRDLLDLSDILRKELAGLPAHVIKRKIRDTLDEARLLMGARARAGEQGLTEEIKARLVQEAKER